MLFLLQCLENPTCPPILYPKDIRFDLWKPHRSCCVSSCLAQLFSQVQLVTSAISHFPLGMPSMDPVTASKGPHSTSHVATAWHNPSAYGHRSTSKAPSRPAPAKPRQNALAQCNIQKEDHVFHWTCYKSRSHALTACFLELEWNIKG